MKRPLFLLALLLIASSSALAQKPSKVPARCDSMAVCQPNGTSVYVVLLGDEHKRLYTTTDGFVVKKNKKGYFCYAKQSCNGIIKPSHRIICNIGQRSKQDNRYLKRMKKNPNLYIGNILKQL